jgi:PhzF family phenazine biosynthesis protein
MKSVTFKKLDAFSTNGSSGNPAGAIYLNHKDEVGPSEMQQIAIELGVFVSEVAFVLRIGPNHYWIRYYSSEREVDFCGHATIAVMYDLICTNPDLSVQEQISISTNNSKLIIENHVQTDDCVFVSAPSPRIRPFIDTKAHLSKALHIDVNEVDDSHPISIINAGLETLIVPLTSLKNILSVSPDFAELKSYCIDNSIDIITLFSKEVAFNYNQYRTRVFAPTFGYLEDPATGSGNAAFGHFLLLNSIWNGSQISIEQNNSSDKPNIVKLVAYKEQDQQYRVLFGGNARTKIEGKYYC